MNMRKWMSAGAVSGAVAVVAGSFGAHGLKDHLDEQQLAWWTTGVQYQFWSLPGLLVLGFLQCSRAARASGWCFVAGSAIFSGTLYAMALGAPRWLGAVTPVGGLLLIAGWVLLAAAARRASRDAD